MDFSSWVHHMLFFRRQHGLRGALYQASLGCPTWIYLGYIILAWVRHQNAWSLGFKYGYCPKVTLLSTKGNKSHRIQDILMG